MEKAKRNWFIGIGVAVIAIVAVLMTIFCIKTCNVEPAPTEFTMTGTWKMYTRNPSVPNSDDTVLYLDFTNEKMTAYKGKNSTTVYLESAYELDLIGGKLSLTEKNITYTVLGKLSDNFLDIVDASQVEYALVRCNDKNLNGNFDNITGEWQGVIKDKEANTDTVKIENGNLTLTKAGETAPYINLGYSISEKGLVSFGPYNYEIAYLSQNSVILVEISSGSVFELKK